MMGLFLCMVSFVIGFLYRSAKDSDRKKMVAPPTANPGA